VDPNGQQSTSTAASVLGFAALVGSGAGDTVASALGLGNGSAQLFTAGLSLQSLGRLSLFAVGLLLVGLGIILNVASLIHRWHLSREYDARVAAAHEEERKKEQRDKEKCPPGDAG
jgi:hypothetical protein